MLNISSRNCCKALWEGIYRFATDCNMRYIKEEINEGYAVMWPLKSLILILFVLTLSSCGGGSGSDSSDEDDADSSNDETSDIKELTEFEQGFAKRWVYFHNFDSSFRYYIFHADRTACWFEVTNTGRVIGYRSYIDWELRGGTSENGFEFGIYVALEGSDAGLSLRNTYEFTQSRIRYLSGYMLPSDSPTYNCN